MAMAASRVMTARTGVAGRLGPVVLAVGLAALAVAGTRALSGQSPARTLAAVFVVGGSFWFVGTKRTSLALAVLMGYLGLLDGYLKLSTGSSTVTLVRDVLLYAIVAGLLLRAQTEGRRLVFPPLSGWVIAYVAFVLVQLANPHGGTLTHSFTGVRPHLEFVPLFFLGYLTVRNPVSLRRFVILLLVIAAANGIVGYVQFNLSPGQVAAWGPGYAERINGTGRLAGRVFLDAAGTQRLRPFGLGSDAGSGGLFGVLAIGGVFALASPIFPLKHRLAALTLGAGAAAAIITSQGRGVVVAAVITVLAYAVMTATSQRRLASLSGLAVAGLIAYLVGSSLVAQAGSGAFRYQGLSASKIIATTNSVNGRPAQLSIIQNAIVRYPLGAGLGIAGPASGSSGGPALDASLNGESEFSFLVLEVGIPGLLAVVGFTVLLLGLALSRCRREPDPEARVLLAAVISPLAGILVDFYAGAGTVSVPDGPYLWFIGGVGAYWLITRNGERARPEGLSP